MKILLAIESMLLPDIYCGDAERVVWYLAKELNRLGHSVSILAKKRSRCNFAETIIRDCSLELHQQIPDSVDFVHVHSVEVEVKPEKFRKISKPYVVTYYDLFVQNPDNDRAIYLSKSHAMTHGSQEYVYSGIDWSEYSRNVDIMKRRRDLHLVDSLSCGGECNLSDAMWITRRVDGAKLKVVGRGRLALSVDLRTALSHRVRFYRSISDERRAEIILNSRGLIFCAKFNEPFGLQIIESLFFGTPIFGTPRGSLEELVTSEFGLLSSEPAELVRAINEAEFDPYRCHQYAMDCFNSQVMTLQYLKKYDIILSKNSLE